MTESGPFWKYVLYWVLEVLEKFWRYVESSNTHSTTREYFGRCGVTSQKHFTQGKSTLLMTKCCLFFEFFNFFEFWLQKWKSHVWLTHPEESDLEMLEKFWRYVESSLTPPLQPGNPLRGVESPLKNISRKENRLCWWQNVAYFLNFSNFSTWHVVMPHETLSLTITKNYDSKKMYYV